MARHQIHDELFETYFCTFSCYKWRPLFELTNSYDAVCNWFTHLSRKGCLLTGYVIMPNHLHALLHPTEPGFTLNQLVGTGKRFLAYELINRLQLSRNSKMLKELQSGVSPREKKQGKKHQVFRPSFDARLCFSVAMLEQKLDYIHRNPVSGKWNLVSDYVNYPHSSAAFYELGIPDYNAPLVHYKELPGAP